MILHVLQNNNIKVDYVLGAQLDGLKTQSHSLMIMNLLLLRVMNIFHLQLTLLQSFLNIKPILL